MKAWHDNTAANKANPDPNVWVGYGGRTVDEMAHAWVNVTYLKEEEYLGEIRARQAKLQPTAAEAAVAGDSRADSYVALRCVAAAAWRRLIARGRRSRSPRAPLPVEPLGGSGESIYPGVRRMGTAQGRHAPSSCSATTTAIAARPLDIPIGPNNRIEPGGPDQGQPTHFEPASSTACSRSRCPRIRHQKLTWTLTVNGQTTSVSFWLNPPYFLDFFKNAASGNEPPVIRFAPDGPALTGPPLGIAQTLSGTVGQPFRCGCGPPTWPARAKGRRRAGRVPAAAPIRSSSRSRSSATACSAALRGAASPRPRPDIMVHWSDYRGPAPVAFAQARVPLVTKNDPKAVRRGATTATFDTPGDYVLRAQINDESGEGGGGDQCCWTTALVKVTVK